MPARAAPQGNDYPSASPPLKPRRKWLLAGAAGGFGLVLGVAALAYFNSPGDKAREDRDIAGGADLAPRDNPTTNRTSPAEPVSPLALVGKPVPLPGVRNWSIETRGHLGDVPLAAFSPTTAGWPPGAAMARSGSGTRLRVVCWPSCSATSSALPAWPGRPITKRWPRPAGMRRFGFGMPRGSAAP